MTQEIHTTGHPRSGNNWIIRLLSDVLDSPINRDGMHWFGGRTGRFVLFFHHGTVEALQQYLNTDKYVIFNYRDPRSVFVSTMFFQRYATLDEAIGEHLSTYTNFVRPWWERRHTSNIIPIRYEELHDTPIRALRKVLQQLNVTKTNEELLAAAERHSIQNELMAVRAQLKLAPNSYVHGFHKGSTTEWMEHFKQHHGQRIQESPVSQLMMDQKYITNPTWWRKLPV